MYQRPELGVGTQYHMPPAAAVSPVGSPLRDVLRPVEMHRPRPAMSRRAINLDVVYEVAICHLFFCRCAPFLLLLPPVLQLPLSLQRPALLLTLHMKRSAISLQRYCTEVNLASFFSGPASSQSPLHLLASPTTSSLQHLQSHTAANHIPSPHRHAQPDRASLQKPFHLPARLPSTESSRIPNCQVR